MVQSGLLFSLGAVGCKNLIYSLLSARPIIHVTCHIRAAEWTVMKQGVTLNISLVFDSLVSIRDCNQI